MPCVECGGENDEKGTLDHCMIHGDDGDDNFENFENGVDGDDDDDEDEFAGLEYLREFSNSHPGIVYSDLVSNDVDVSLDSAGEFVAHIVIDHINQFVMSPSPTATTTMAPISPTTMISATLISPTTTTTISTPTSPATKMRGRQSRYRHASIRAARFCS